MWFEAKMIEYGLKYVWEQTKWGGLKYFVTVIFKRVCSSALGRGDALMLRRDSTAAYALGFSAASAAAAVWNVPIVKWKRQP